MNRQQKELVVQLLREQFTQSPASFVVGYKGLTVVQMQELRRKVRASGGSLKVTKARLMKLAVDSNTEMLKPYFKEQVGIVFANQEATAVAKALYDFSKNHEALQLVAGQFESQLLDKKAIARIAMLPSRDQLLAILCGTLQAPISALARVINMHAQALQQPAEEKTVENTAGEQTAESIQ